MPGGNEQSVVDPPGSRRAKPLAGGLGQDGRPSQGMYVTPVLPVMLARTPDASGWTLPVTVRPST